MDTSTRTTAKADFGHIADALDAMSDAEVTEWFRELEERRRADEAAMAAIVDRVDRTGAYRDDGHRSVSGWVRAHANCSSGRASRLGRVGRLLRTEPTVGEELASGRIGVEQAEQLGRAHANPRCGDQLGESLPLLLGYANRLEFDEFRLLVKRWETLADLDGAHRDRGAAEAARRAMLAAGENGVDLVATGGTALEAAGLEKILDAFTDLEFQIDVAEARERLGDDAADVPQGELARTDAQRRFDALVKLFHVANNSDAEATPPAVTVDVMIDQHSFETQLAAHGLADTPDDLPRPDPAEAMCHTDRGVPLLPHDVVGAALDGWVRRRVVDSAGVTIDLGHRSRLFTGAAADAARQRVTRCEHPGCAVPAHWAQIDHITEWEDHGPTNQRNAAILCGHHNRFKHRHKLTAQRGADGQLFLQRPDSTWITAVGVDPPGDPSHRPAA